MASKFVRAAELAVEGVARFLALFSGFALLVLIFVLFYGVVMRYIFDSPVRWVLDVTSFLQLVVGSLSLAYTQRHRGHVRVELLLLRLSPRPRNVLAAAMWLLFAAFAVFAFWGSWDRAWFSLAKGLRSAGARVPMFPVEAFMLLGLAMLSLQLCLDVVKTAVGAKAGKLVN